MKAKNFLRAFTFCMLVSFAMASPFSMSGEPVATHTSVAPQPSVKVLPGRVEITNPGEEARNVTIYSLTGQVIKSFVAQPGTTAIELNPGYYIIKCDRISMRVVVK